MPKTVSAAQVGELLGQEIPEDGSQDVLNLTEDGELTYPMLFIDALDVDDPLGAATLRAQGRPI